MRSGAERDGGEVCGAGSNIGTFPATRFEPETFAEEGIDGEREHPSLAEISELERGRVEIISATSHRSD